MGAGVLVSKGNTAVSVWVAVAVSLVGVLEGTAVLLGVGDGVAVSGKGIIPTGV